MTVAAQLLAAYDPEDVRPGWIALVLLLVMALATFLLWRNMNKQLGRIDVPTEAEVRARAQQEADGSTEDATDPEQEEPTDGQSAAGPPER